MDYGVVFLPVEASERGFEMVTYHVFSFELAAMSYEPAGS